MATRVAHDHAVSQAATDRSAPVRFLRTLLRRLHFRSTAEREAKPMDDPLAHLAAALKELLHKQAKLDRLELDAPDDPERERIARWRETNMQAVDHLERAIAAVPAGGPQEALIQVMIAAGRIQQLSAETAEERLDEELAVARLLLRSALPVLAHAVGVDLVAAGAAHYGQSSADSPFWREEAGEPPGGTRSSGVG